MLFLFLNAFFLSYIGSSVSYVAISKAPNAGYSLIIQKSYAVYTSIAAIYLFHSTLTVTKFVAILIVLASTAFISISPDKKVKKQNYWWVILSFISFFCFGTLRLTNKMFVSAGVPVIVLLFWTQAFVAFFSTIDYLLHKEKLDLKIHRNDIPILVALGISVTFFYYFLQISEVTAPNIGYVNILNTASNAVYTILVAWLFKDKLTKEKILAVITATIGIIILVI
jgi:drug/metabolite transporter (DMT)-like permease